MSQSKLHYLGIKVMMPGHAVTPLLAKLSRRLFLALPEYFIQHLLRFLQAHFCPFMQISVRDLIQYALGTF